MALYDNLDRLVIFDADGTTIDSFRAIEQTFLLHGMDIGNLERFQKRRNLFKFLGGLREFPINLRHQFGKQNRKRLLHTLTEVYRHEALLYPGIDSLLRTLLDSPDIRVGLVTRNVTIEPEKTLKELFRRHEIDTDKFDGFACIPFKADKFTFFRRMRETFAINPARAYACGDEHGDYLAAIKAGMHPFIVSYGFEDRKRLAQKYSVPEEVISPSPAEFIGRLKNALGLSVHVPPQAAPENLTDYRGAP